MEVNGFRQIHTQNSKSFELRLNMKNYIIIYALLASVPAFGQGTVINGNTASTLTEDQPVYDVDGVTKLASTKGLFELIYNGTILSQNGTSGQPFIRGLDGFFGGSTVTIPGAPAGSTAQLTILFWDKTTGTTYDTATARASQTFTTPVLSSGTVRGQKIIDGPAGFRSLSLTAVPEPSELLLTMVGLGGLLIAVRRK